MGQGSSTNFLPWLALCSAALTLLFADAMWSASVDLAHHYSLAYRIGEQWTLTDPEDPSLGEMNVYPRGAHMAAAMVGKLAGSTFAGLQLVSVFSLAAIWSGILLILHSLSRRLAHFSIAAFVALMMVNAVTLKLDVHGYELVESFFFSQIAGHAVLMLSLAVAIRLEKAAGPVNAMLVLCGLLFVNMWIHLLPAIEMLGVICSLALIQTLVDWLKDRTFRVSLLGPLAIGAAAIAGTVLHPSFAAMLSISGNPGALNLHNLSYPVGLVGLCAVIVLTSSALLLAWFRTADRFGNVALKYIACFGLASAGACLLQFTLTAFGMGSDYAVKKYAFGLTTVLILQLSVLAATAFVRIRRLNAPVPFDNSTIFNGLVLTAALMIVFVVNVPARKSVDVSDVVATERRLAAMADTVIPAPPADKYTVVVGIEDVPYTLNYMFSLGIFKTPRPLLKDLLSNNRLTDVSHFSSIVTSKSNPYFGPGECVGHVAAHFSVLDGKCLSYRSLEFDSADFRIEPRIALTPSNFAAFGPANFDTARGLVQSDTFVDAGYSSEEVFLPAGRYKLDAVFDWEVQSENVALNAGHLSLHGQRILVPIVTSSVTGMEVSSVFLTDGKPFRIAYGLGGWSTGKGTIELKSMTISEVIPVAGN